MCILFMHSQLYTGPTVDGKHSCHHQEIQYDEHAQINLHHKFSSQLSPLCHKSQ